MKIFSFLSKKMLIYIGIGAVVAIVIAVVLNRGDGKQEVIVSRADIIQEVVATGKIKPNQSVDLGFDKSSRIASVYFLLGDKVKRGQTIVSLETEKISADLEKARALLLEENIKLREMKSTAPISHNDASKNLTAAIKSGFTDADDAVRNKADQFFGNNIENPQFGISITSGNFIHYFNVPSDIKISINNSRKKVETILVSWQKKISDLNSNSTNLVSEANKAINDLNTISAFLNKVAETVNNFTSVEYAYDTTVNNYKATILSARSEVSGAISTIVTAKDKLNAAPVLGKNGQFENILIQEAKVKQAEASVSSLKASLAQSVIKAPFDGVITLQDAKVGATVLPGNTLVSIISQNKIYIEADISEIHIGKIAINNPVSITFDAFPTETFLGKVSYIEPGNVIVDGVVNYKIRISLTNPENKIRNGLTSNLKIQTAKKENVLSLPLYAILKENNQTFVNKIIEADRTQKIPVVLGLVGSNSMVEILSGLKAGDKVEF